MTASPAASSPASSSSVASVASPAGTITHTARGAASCATSAGSESAAVAPAPAAARSASALRSKATTECPPRCSRAVMFAPIFPSPTIPICMRGMAPWSYVHVRDECCVPRAACESRSGWPRAGASRAAQSTWHAALSTQHSVSFLDLPHLRQPPPVSLLAAEGGADEGARQLLGQLGPHDAAAEHEDVHVVVLHALVRRVAVVAEPRAHAGDLVGGDRSADAAAADEDPALGAPLDHGERERLGDVRVVHRLAAVGAEVGDLVPQLAERLRDLPLALEAGVVGGDGDAHAILRAWLVSATARRHHRAVPSRWGAERCGAGRANAPYSAGRDPRTRRRPCLTR